MASLLGEGNGKTLSSYGFLGVEVFFVISGCVIPLSMWRANYRWRDFGDYFAKRMFRVHLPFLIACLLAIVLNLVSMRIPGYSGTLPDSYLSDALGSLPIDGLYLSGLLGRPWILVVAWTLAIEVQFYLLAGILVPLLKPDHPRVTLAALMVLSASAWALPDARLVFAHLAYFALGWAAALAFQGKNRENPWTWMGYVALAILTLILTSLPAAIAGIVASGYILWWKWPIARFWGWLGMVSYSLYLVHVPLGGRVVNLMTRFADGAWQLWAISLLATGFSLLAAWFFWRWVEVPSQRWSRCWKRSTAP